MAPRSAAFVIGSAVTEFDFRYVLADMLLTWSASDPSGACSFSLYEEDGGAQGRYPLFEDRTYTSWIVKASDWDAPDGGGSAITNRWIIHATDCAGNVARRTVPHSLHAAQEDDPTVRYSGPWVTSSCDCWLLGTTRQTTSRGATATIRRYFGPAEPIALVMTKGPGRGLVDIHVDGRYRTTVDTHARHLLPGIVVWQSRMRRGTHEITLVNKATAGRPRIGLDAVLTS